MFRQRASQTPNTPIGEFNLWPLFWLLVVMFLWFAYTVFYPTQLTGAVRWVSMIVAGLVSVPLAGSWLAGVNRSYAKSGLGDVKIKPLVWALMWITLTLLGSSCMRGALDFAEGLINDNPWQNRVFVITGLDDGRGGRLRHTTRIQINPDGHIFPIAVAIPDAQYRQLSGRGTAGQCVVIPARPAILGGEQLYVGCLSTFCTTRRAEIVPCPGR